MVNRMEELNRIHREKINSLNISQDKNTHQFKSRSDAAKPQGDLKEEIYDLYYDNDSTITTALDTTPTGGRILDSGNTNYNVEKIFEFVERNAPYVWVVNDATTNDAAHTLFVIHSHIQGEFNFSKERPIYAQQYKVYKNVYEIRVRSPTQGLAYRVSEYEMGAL